MSLRTVVVGRFGVAERAPLNATPELGSAMTVRTTLPPGTMGFVMTGKID